MRGKFSVVAAVMVFCVWLAMVLDLRQRLQLSQEEASQLKVRQEWMGGYMVELLKACQTNDVVVPRNFSTNWGLNIRTTGEVAVIHYE